MRKTPFAQYLTPRTSPLLKHRKQQIQILPRQFKLVGNILVGEGAVVHVNTTSKAFLVAHKVYDAAFVSDTQNSWRKDVAQRVAGSARHA